MEDGELRQTEQAPFNIAVATLLSLRDILKDIKLAMTNIDLTDERKQEMKIFLVKSFFISASPLLNEDVDNFRGKIMELKPSLKPVYKKGGLGEIKFSHNEVKYDPELNVKLDNFLIDIQITLQKKGHFMPPADVEGGWD